MTRVSPVTSHNYRAVSFQKQDISFCYKKENSSTQYINKYNYDFGVVAMLSTCAAGLLLLVTAIKLRSSRIF